jgi:2-oxoglutarate dehydrogenase E2 component (dihydrolipoamide succinyltransferase)
MGDSITEGTVQSFVKNVGEYVALDEIVAVIETDKVNVDIRCAHAGVIKKFFAEEGDTVEVNADFFELDTDGKPDAAAASPPPA